MCNKKEELWLPVKGFEGYYEVSNLGNVRSLGRIITTKSNAERVIYGKLIALVSNTERSNYVYVTLKYKEIKVTKAVHRLVAESFINNPNNLPQVNHKDYDVQNNCIDNLEWCDAAYNVNYSKDRRKNMRGKFGRKIKAFDKFGNLVGEYGSIRDAGRQLNVAGQNISGVLSGKNKWVKGYTFADA